MENYDPNLPAENNGNFAGLPFPEAKAEIVYIPIPWDITTSHTRGTSKGPQNILEASSQIDLFDENLTDAWKIPRQFQPINREIEKRNTILSQVERKSLLKEVDEACVNMNDFTYTEVKKCLCNGQIPVTLGGDHSVALGSIKACTEYFKDVDVLQIDAHMDLRSAYEGFQYSHASVFYHVMTKTEAKKLYALGIRDFCPEEKDFSFSLGNRYHLMTAQDLFFRLLEGERFSRIIRSFIDGMSEKVYLSLDIDALDIQYNPGTGTPVPGGLHYYQLIYMIHAIVKSGRELVGLDICETGSRFYSDGFVSAKLAYSLSNLAFLSQRRSIP